MKLRHWAQVLGTVFSIPFTAGQGTTISIGITYCPPSGTIQQPLPTIGPLAPYYLFVAEGLGGPFSYINSDGHFTDITDAAQFIITSEGQLIVGSELVARNGNAVIQPFAVGPDTGSISTTFSPENGLLRWRNNAFGGGEASFCKTNDTVLVSFNGTLPNDCQPTLIGLLLVSSLFAQPVSSSGLTETSSPTYSTTSSLSASSIASSTVGNTVSTSSVVSLPGSLAATSTSTPLEVVSTTSLTSSNSISAINHPSSATPISVAGSSHGGSFSSSTFLSISATSTGPVSTITTSPTNSIASPSLSSTTSLQTSTASTNAVTGSTTSTNLVSTLPTSPVTSTTPDLPPTPTTSTSNPATEFPASSNTITTTNTAGFTSITPIVFTESAPSILAPISENTSVDISSTPSASGTVAAPSSTSQTSEPTSIATNTACPILPLSSNLCPSQSGTSYSLDEDSSCYGVLCSTSLAGTVITANSTTANNLRSCVAYCALFNEAIPYSCLGISYLGSTVPSGTSNCLLYGQITSELEGSDGVDSIRLIYPGYPVVQKRDTYAEILDAEW